MKRDYTKLPGRGHRMFFDPGIYRLYLGPDHLLSVQSSRMNERYKRFFFSDIRGFVLQKTARGIVANIILGILCLICAWGAAETFKYDMLLVWAIPFGLFFGLLLWNLASGPTCRAKVHTAVNQDWLPSLGRLKIARRVLNRIRPLIESTQGTLESTPGQPLPARAAAQYSSVGTGLTASPPPSLSGPEPFKGKAHLWMFGILLFCGVLVCAALFIVSPLIIGTLCVSVLALVVLTIVSLIAGSRAQVGRALASLTWMSAVFCTSAFILGYVELFMAIEENPLMPTDQFALISYISNITPADYPALMIAYSVLSVIACGAGLAGLLLVTRLPGRRS